MKEFEVKFQQVNDAKSVIKDVEKRIASLSEFNKKLSENTKELINKEEDVKKILNLVNITNARLDEIEKRFKIFNDDFDKLDKRRVKVEDYIKDVEDKVLDISKKEDKIEEFFTKYEEFEGLRVDLDTRTKQLQKIRKILIDQQDQLEKLIKEADDRISNFLATVETIKSSFEKEKPELFTKQLIEIEDKKTKSVLRLHQQGWTVSEIAKSLNIPESEVKFIISIYK
jgi:chromosome segregation ATPase